MKSSVDDGGPQVRQGLLPGLGVVLYQGAQVLRGVRGMPVGVTEPGPVGLLGELLVVFFKELLLY